jgi:zeaxanthin glucosyltransferase
MLHFGVLSYKGTGHLNPMIALSRRLMARGHRVTFFHTLDLEEKVRCHGLEFSALSMQNDRCDGHGRKTRKDNLLSYFLELRDGVNRIAGDMESFLRILPDAICKAGVNVLLVSEISLSGPTVAELLNLPYFIVSTSIPHNFGWSAPRSIARPGSWRALLKRHVLEVSVLCMRGPVRRRLDRFRTQAGLGPIHSKRATYPELAHITQWPQCLDQPRQALPANFFYTGPFFEDTARLNVDFPWTRLDGRPLIYASLGTTRKGDLALFQRIAEACQGLDAQLVISLGGRRNPEALAGLPGDPVVVTNAPQLELLKRAQVVITHAGPNTVLESLAHGKPMVALPILLDQPAVAACLRRHGAAVVLATENRSSQHICRAIEEVQTNPTYRNVAERLQTEMQTPHGLACAVDIIESAMAQHV